MGAEAAPQPVDASAVRGVDTRLSAVGTDAIHRAVSSLGLTLQSYASAVWAAFLGRHGVETPVPVRFLRASGLPGAGSEATAREPESPGALVHIEVWDDRSVAEHLRRVHGFLEGLERPASERTTGADAGFDAPFQLRTPVHGELALEVRDGATLELTLLHDPVQLGADTAVSMAGHLKRLMVNMALDPEPPLAGVPMLSERDLQRLLVEWNPDPAQQPADRLAHERFEEGAEADPDRIAVVCDGAFWTYRELNQRANRLAHHLRGRGIAPDSVVAVRLDRSLEALVGLLGTLKSGGAILPLDPGLPPGELAHVLRDSGTRAVVTRGRFVHEFEATGLPVVGLDSDEVLLQERTEDPRPVSGPDHLAYVHYGTGPTGPSVGAAVEHRQLLHRLFGMREGLGLDAASTHAILPESGSGPDPLAVLSALTSGGSIHLVSPTGEGSDGIRSDYFDRHRVDYLHLAAAELEALPNGSPGSGLHPRTCLVMDATGRGVPWSPRMARLTADGRTILGRSGPSPTLDGVFAYRVVQAPAGTREEGRLPLGRPLPGFRCYVVDHAFQPVPIGVPGELLIGGIGLARGYLNHPGLTRERFVPNPFGPGRVYRTGDRVRYLSNGDLEHLGRVEAETHTPALDLVRRSDARSARGASDRSIDPDRPLGRPAPNGRQVVGGRAVLEDGSRSIHASHSHRWESDER